VKEDLHPQVRNELTARRDMRHPDPDIQHALTEAIRQQCEIDTGAKRAVLSARFEQFVHGIVYTDWHLCQTREFVTGDHWRFVQGQQQRRSVLDAARRDCPTEVENPCFNRPWNRLVERVEGFFSNTIEIVVVPVHELDDDGLFGVEVVIKAARQDAALLGDVRERCPKSRRGEQLSSRLKDLFPARTLG
jgi:hypothetical protein